MKSRGFRLARSIPDLRVSESEQNPRFQYLHRTGNLVFLGFYISRTSGLINKSWLQNFQTVGYVERNENKRLASH